MMQTDVSSSHLSTSGTMYNGPTRLRGLIICPAVSTAATIRFRDGSATGSILLEIDVVANTNPNTYTFDIPGEGIRFPTSLYMTTSAAVTGVTVFYG
jgi:hypothetical protein